jgi:hypothetical protein
MSDMALTEGKVGYMLPIEVRVVGETVLPEWCEPGECCEGYDSTLLAGVKAGVSEAVEGTGFAWEPPWEVARPGGELLVR